MMTDSCSTTTIFNMSTRARAKRTNNIQQQNTEPVLATSRSEVEQRKENNPQDDGQQTVTKPVELPQTQEVPVQVQNQPPILNNNNPSNGQYANYHYPYAQPPPYVQPYPSHAPPTQPISLHQQTFTQPLLSHQSRLTQTIPSSQPPLLAQSHVSESFQNSLYEFISWYENKNGNRNTVIKSEPTETKEYCKIEDEGKKDNNQESEKINNTPTDSGTIPNNYMSNLVLACVDVIGGLDLDELTKSCIQKLLRQIKPTSDEVVGLYSSAGRVKAKQIASTNYKEHTFASRRKHHDFRNNSFKRSRAKHNSHR